ncbi:MAG: hypothetical protein KatS3mg035_1083 [Bacteroidia bacterium]|nr:MAG: hypothetical protein KatS3mg035_1083 [Bacteroidia bacterium]
MEEKKSALDRILKSLTPEDLEELKQKRLNNISISFTRITNSVFMWGEYIVDRYLPTLSIDAIHTKNNISVTCAEGDECRKLHDIWFNKTHEVRARLNLELRERASATGKDWAEIDRKTSEETEAEWNALRAYHHMLEEKISTKDCRLLFTTTKHSRRTPPGF